MSDAIGDSNKTPPIPKAGIAESRAFTNNQGFANSADTAENKGFADNTVEKRRFC